MLVLSVVDREFELQSGQTNVAASLLNIVLISENKDWLARKHVNVSEWSDMSIRGLLFQWTSTIKIQLSLLI